MKIKIAIITCDRGQFALEPGPAKKNTLARMCESLIGSGLPSQMEEGEALGVFDGGPRAYRWAEECVRLSKDLHAKVWQGPRQTRLDIVRNTHRAMAWLAGSGTEYGVLLSDDFVCCRNWFPRLKHWLKNIAPKEAAAYALCARYPFTRDPGNLERGWAPYPLEHFYCAICAYPREVPQTTC